MKKLILNSNRHALVDDEDFAYLSQWKWSFNGKYATRHVTRENGKRTTCFMHREILKPPTGVWVDHINQNKLDNRRCNLRDATKSQNTCNQPIRPDNTSGFKGVSWYKLTKKWVAYISIDGKRKTLGYFRDRLEAARAYNTAAHSHYGAFARLNQVKGRP